MSFDHQINQFHEWASTFLSHNAQSQNYVKAIYMAYFVHTLNMGLVPLKQKTFVTALKKHEKEHIESSRVLFRYSDRPCVVGLSITSFPSHCPESLFSMTYDELAAFEDTLKKI